ncbi:GL21611 [Drosophila persimilis]|uniref:GL21611 n=1 Tax=Drosophila persimilis TaxID=7234 RepID=B4GFK0_DROPE|nr:uncharacterized protein LOC6592149 [Drosophila persimilis]EDW34385.1 GL21611 [Drosophila persimilis]
MPESDVTKMKVADLKRELKMRGLPVNGNKNELQDRLQTALLEGDISLEDSAIADAIDDDDVSLADDDEDKLLGDEHDDDELLKSPVGTPTAAIVPDLLLDEHSALNEKTIAAAALPAKKIVLKRNNSQLASTTAGCTTTPTIASKENGAPTANKDTPEETPTKTKRIPIVVGGSKEGEKSADKKLTELTAEERLNLRAKKFGITPTIATASIATAINKSSSASIVANKGNKETDEKQKEALKRRAERFGCVVPEKTTKTLADERLLKRKERFGTAVEASSTPATAAATPESKAIYSEKARARLERFKTAPAAATPK